LYRNAVNVLFGQSFLTTDMPADFAKATILLHAQPHHTANFASRLIRRSYKAVNG